jgi:hypothetical protein
MVGLADLAACLPVGAERAGQPGQQLRVGSGLGPGKHHPQVVVLTVQPRQPASLVGAPQLGPGPLGQVEEVGRVPAADGVGLTAGPEPFPGVLTDSFQQPQPPRLGRLGPVGLPIGIGLAP